MNKRISIKKGRKLIREWETIVNFYIESPYEGRFYIYDYLHEMDTRAMLEEHLDRLKKNVKSVLIPVVKQIDSRLIEITVPSDCIWGEENQKIHNWKPLKHWWLFRRPKDVKPGWGWDDK